MSKPVANLGFIHAHFFANLYSLFTGRVFRDIFIEIFQEHLLLTGISGVTSDSKTGQNLVVGILRKEIG